MHFYDQSFFSFYCTVLWNWILEKLKILHVGSAPPSAAVEVRKATKVSSTPSLEELAV